jgi:hypothetical protein
MEEPDVDQIEVINELREAVAQLKAALPQRRIHNQQQTAHRLNMSVSKLRQEQKAGRIKGVMSGRIWTFTDAAIQEYLAQLEAV